MPVSREEVLHIASLARFRLDPERVDALARELSSILGHMEVLSGVDTAGVHPTGESVSAGTPLRDDLRAPSGLSLPLESIAPDMADGFFIVPRLATHEDAAEPGE